jgi:hypothetical protein
MDLFVVFLSQLFVLILYPVSVVFMVLHFSFDADNISLILAIRVWFRYSTRWV